MEKLLQPDFGLMFWTIITFLALVFVLGRFAWAPLLRGIDEREQRMRQEREGAEKARAEAEKIQKELEARLAGLDAKAREVLAQAEREAEALRERHSQEAQREAELLMAKTRQGLEDEKRRLIGELRQEVARLSVTAAEKLVRKTVDAGVRKAVLDQFFRELDEPAERS